MFENIWVVKANNRELQNLSPLLEFLLQMYAQIVGPETMIAEKCIVYNDTGADYPMLITNTTPIEIRLAVEDTSYWCQLLYQLAHELQHYVLRQLKSNKDTKISWFEEIYCEAMSLYALDYAGTNWSQCALSKLDPTFGTNMLSYLHAELAKQGTDRLQRCSTLELLAKYEKEAEEDRAAHRNERNYLYQEISKAPAMAKELNNYSKYVLKPDGVTIDLDCWRKEAPNDLLSIVEKIQPCDF